MKDEEVENIEGETLEQAWSKEIFYQLTSTRTLRGEFFLNHFWPLKFKPPQKKKPSVSCIGISKL